MRQLYEFVCLILVGAVRDLTGGRLRKVRSYFDHLTVKQREAVCRYLHAFSQASLLGAITMAYTRRFNGGVLFDEAVLLTIAYILCKRGIAFVKEQ
jgi:hypothetical protein